MILGAGKVEHKIPGGVRGKTGIDSASQLQVENQDLHQRNEKLTQANRQLKAQSRTGNGIPVYEYAREKGCSASTIYDIIHRLEDGKTTRSKYWSPAFRFRTDDSCHFLVWDELSENTTDVVHMDSIDDSQPERNSQPGLFRVVRIINHRIVEYKSGAEFMVASAIRMAQTFTPDFTGVTS